MTAQQLKNAILQEAIQGRLVPQDPNDEPASVLLERIRTEKERLIQEGKIKRSKKSASDDEIEAPFEIPESWEWCKLGNIMKLKSGECIRIRSLSDDSKYPVYGGNGINGSYNDYNVEAETLIIGRVGFYCGSIHKTNSKAWITDNALIVTYNKSLFYVDYLKYALKYLNLSSTSNSTAQPVVSGKGIYPLLIPIPPLVEQQRIVAKIEELLPKVEEYGKAQEKLNKLNEELPERLKKSILQEAIEGRLVKQDPNDEPASALLAKIREEKKRLVKEGKLKKKDLEEKPISEDEIPFEIPESWEWCKLGSIATLIGGFAFKSNEYTSTGSRVIRISDITEEGFINKNVVRYPYNERLKPYVINRGDILMAMTGGTVGKSLYVRTLPEESMLLNQRVANIRVNTVLTDYIDYVIKSQHIQNIITDAKNSTNDNISMADIYSFPIPLPPLAEQHRIVAKIEQLLKQIDKL